MARHEDRGQDGDSTGFGPTQGIAGLRARLLARIESDDDDMRPDMARRARANSGSVTRGLAKRLATGKMFGRGAGARARLTTGVGSSSGGSGAFSVTASQRVVVKAFVARHGGARGVRGGSSAGKAIAGHIRYLARDGAGLEGGEATFYGSECALAREAVRADTGAWADDRHHFRLIISPEHGDRIEDLQGYIRDVMMDVAKELKEPDLHWVAVNHYDTDQPHAHVLIRGKRANGQVLVIPRQIIGHTIREHAQARAQELLGDQSRDQAEKGLFIRARADRWTDIDFKLTTLAARSGSALPSSEYGRRDTFGAIVRARVAHLEALGLARCDKRGVTFAPDLKARLDALQQARDEIRSHWDRARSQAFKKAQEARLTQKETPATAQTTAQSKHSGQAFPDPTLDRLIPADVELARRGLGSARPHALDDATHAHLAARRQHLTAKGLARPKGEGLAFPARTWRQLEQAELRQAIESQLGIKDREITIQTQVSEGRVLGHVETSLGRSAIVDRGVALTAVREMPGHELMLGQVLGLGAQR